MRVLHENLFATSELCRISGAASLAVGYQRTTFYKLLQSHTSRRVSRHPFLDFDSNILTKGAFASEV